MCPELVYLPVMESSMVIWGVLKWNNSCVSAVWKAWLGQFLSHPFLWHFRGPCLSSKWPCASKCVHYKVASPPKHLWLISSSLTYSTSPAQVAQMVPLQCHHMTRLPRSLWWVPTISTGLSVLFTCTCENIFWRAREIYSISIIDIRLVFSSESL